MVGVTPIKHIKNWTDTELKEFCEHVISHQERYFPERVFEAKEILNGMKGANK